MVLNVLEQPFPPIEDVLSSKGKIKILKVLTFHEEINISGIVRITRLNNASVTQHLNYFKELGMIKEKSFGRIKIIQINSDNIRMDAIRNLIEFWEQTSEEGEE